MTDLIQEYVDSRDVTLKVDRTHGILRGVKLIGLQSRNGRRYQEAALKEAAAMYEGAKVNVNHPKHGPASPRDYQDRLGVIRGVELRPGKGLFADFHFNPKHALAEQLLWDAEHNPRNVGFSHNVQARVAREGHVAVVEEITKVQSVDLVADPASTEGLFEQANSFRDGRHQSPAWDALTQDVLELHRPDLLAEIQSAQVQKLQQQLEVTEAISNRSMRKQRIYELLCEHRLTVSADGADTAESARRVSPRFVELLLDATDDETIESLICERADLARLATSNQFKAGKSGVPFSREQQVVGMQRSALPTAAEFAATLKSSLN